MEKEEFVESIKEEYQMAGRGLGRPAVFLLPDYFQKMCEAAVTLIKRRKGLCVRPVCETNPGIQGNADRTG